MTMRRTSGTPGGIRRWSRRRAEVWAVLCLAAALLCQPLTAGVGLAALQDAVDENWRGSYDILVRAPAEDHFSGGPTLLDPNFANTSAPAIAPERVARVAEIDGVEISAPIGFLGRMGDVRDFPIIQIPASLLRENPVRTIRLTWTATTNDGLGPRIADARSATLTIDARAWDGQSEVGPSADTIAVSGDVPAEVTLSGETLRLGIWPLPSVASTVFAVDPDAERRLLGDRAPAALTALADADAALAATDENSSPASGELLANLGPESPTRQALEALVPELRNTPALRGQYGADAPIAPVVVARDALPELALRVGFELGTHGDTDTEFTSVGEATVDAAAALTPFAGSGIVIPWPGTDARIPTTYVQPTAVTGVGATVLSPAPSHIQPPDPDLPAATLEPQGFIRSLPLDSRQQPDGLTPGQTQTFRSDQPPSALRVGSAGSTRLGAPLIVGEYRNAQIVTGKEDAAPLGAYDPVRATRVSDARGNPITPTPLEPVLSGLGIVAQPATALTSLRGAHALGVEAPVTAIRVRVAGAETYSAESLARIDRVAAAIQDLGLEAFIVAGSSRQRVQVWVPDYAFGVTEPQDRQQVSPLGWVEVEALSLNVAQSTVSTLTSLARSIGIGAVLVTLLMLPVLGMVQVRANRRTNAVLTVAGFTRARRARWFAAEGVPVLTAVALAGVLGMLLVPTRAADTAILTGLCLSAVAVLVMVVARRSLAEPRRRRRAQVPLKHTRSPHPTSPGRGGKVRVRTATWRLTISRIPTILTQGILLGFLVSAALFASSLLTVALRETARTPLGSLLGTAQLPALLATMGVGMLAACVLTASTTARQNQAFARQATTLVRVSGWTRSRLRRLTAIELAGIGGIAALSVILLFWAIPAEFSPAAILSPAVIFLGTSAGVLFPLGAIALIRARGLGRALKP
ncbi:hypothetical protein D9V34_08795 [Mycetocola lacteus]|uniref:FtsX-like permease family protein n=1 Tax=Mycetocola lacteus TaxID=76637 RepID=A0A3L7AS15_9MICO|nr:hypothetical protein [Mycetocola lacteus]RLP83309.1 hypothetical protein D9V34_08795 [Mycetocola lacteus]